MNVTQSHDRDAEEMLIGAAYSATGALQREIISKVSVDQFYSETCRMAWRMLLDCLAEGVDLSDRDAIQAAARQIGPWREISTIVSRNLLTFNWTHYHGIVTLHAEIRGLVSVATLITRSTAALLSTDEDFESTPAQIAAEAATALHAILTGGSRTTSVGQREVLRSVFDRLQELERRANAGEIIRARTGVPALDRVFPFREDSIVTLVAESGAGKSSLMAQIGLFTAGSGGKPTLFTHEMSKEDMETRVISQMESIHEGDLLEGNISAGDWAKLSRAALVLRDLPLRIDECPATVEALEQGMRYAHAVHGSTWFIIDYAQLIQVGGVHAKKPKHERMEYLGERLLAIRRELKCGILLLAQTVDPKSWAGGKPTIHHCDSGRGLKQPSDAMIIMYPETPEKARVVIDLGKRRHGGNDEESFKFMAGRISDDSSQSLDEECERRRNLLATYEHTNPDAEPKPSDAKSMLVGRILCAIADDNAEFTLEDVQAAAKLLGVE